MKTWFYYKVCFRLQNNWFLKDAPVSDSVSIVIVEK